MDILKFKQDDKHNLQIEFEKIDFRLRFIVMAWVGEMQYKFNYTPIITEIFRTQEEQEYIYKVLATEEEKQRYAINPVISTHQVWRAVDLRTNDMNEEMIEFTRAYFNYVHYDIGRNIRTLVYHNMGAGIHCHLQVNENGMTCIREIPL